MDEGAVEIKRQISLISSVQEAVAAMAEKDIGSLVVMEYGDLVGMLTFREVLLTLHKNGGEL
ncbi:MAG: CBS domain-containing protein, partial [Thermodesulfobacteriota bacterium]